MLTWIVSPAAHALDTGDIVVTRIQGEVHFTLDGAPRSLKAGAVLKLPAVVRTGKGGSVELTQGVTSIRVGPETELNFPASESRGGPIDRIVQPKGNAFYDIGKREGRKLRVETPVLVGVVKGTQFNVAALEGSATISLFEGRLEILDLNGGAVDLQAGEIASRKLGDSATSVLKMSSEVPKTSSNIRAAGSGLSAGADVTGAETNDNLTSSLLASDLAIASNTSVPSMGTGPVISVPESPVIPVQPEVGTEVPVVGVEPPPVETPSDVGALPDPVPGVDVIDTPVTLPVAPPDVVPDLGTTPDPIEIPDLDEDDGNNGHGNDDDRDDSSNPGRGRSGRE